MADLTPASETLTESEGTQDAALSEILQVPTRAVGPIFQTVLTLANMAVWAAIIPIYTQLLPAQIAGLDPANKVSTLSIVLLIGGVAGLIGQPLAGALSDRTTAAWGRRRPWVLGCAAGTIAGLLLMASASNVVLLTIGFVFYALMVNMTLAPALATIPDLVPVRQRATVSAFVGLAQPVGTLVGAIAVAQIGSIQGSYYAIVGAFLVCILLFVISIREKQLPKEIVPAFSLRTFLSTFLINPLKHRDFGYVWIARAFAILSQTIMVTFLLYFLNGVIHYEKLFPGQTDQQGYAAFQGIYTLLLIVATVVGGVVSDRLQRRKVFVIAGNILMAVAALLIAFVPTWTMVLVMGAVLGFGFGLYISADVALATQVLPDAQNRGKDLGLITAANLIPQLLIPVVSGIAFGLFNGYGALFVIAAVAAVLAAVCIFPVKGVR